MMNARKPVGYESLIVGEDGRDKEGFLKKALIDIMMKMASNCPST